MHILGAKTKCYNSNRVLLIRNVSFTFTIYVEMKIMYAVLFKINIYRDLFCLLVGHFEFIISNFKFQQSKKSAKV